MPTGRETESATARSSSRDGLLVLRGVSKTFAGTVALKDVDFDLRPGEIHALLGENGSGKSTLVKILAGYHTPDPGGECTMNGREFDLGSAAAATACGLRFIHQDLGLIPDLTVFENLALGRGGRRRWWLSDTAERHEAERLLSAVGVGLDAGRMVRDLSSAERTMVAIVRATRDVSNVLVLDEPTATLPADDAHRLFAMIRVIRDQGASIIYVTHRLGEVFELADRATVLRDGVRVATREVNGLTQDDLIALILGRPPSELYVHARNSTSDVVLAVRGLRGRLLRDVAFEVRAGEVFGIAGLTGSGREELIRLLAGDGAWEAGEIDVGGRRLRSLSPRAAIKAGIVYQPADRKSRGAIPELSVADNVTLPGHALSSPLRWLGAGRERADVRLWLEHLRVSPPAPSAALATLSGGNQQRVVIARWLRRDVRVLLLEDPTHGVDVGAKRLIYQGLAEIARGGGAVVATSSDNDELAAICDRVLVLADGTGVGTLAGVELTSERLLEACLAADRPRRLEAIA
jgi:ribose transport system ATP-binding protein